MKKIYSILIIALTLLSTSAKAQNDPDAKKILDAVTAQLKSNKGINASFTLVSKSPAGKINNNVTGKISIKGNKYYIKEGSTEIFNNGEKTWNYNGNDEVTVTPADADDQSFTPQKFLSGFYDKDYTYKLISSAGSFNQIELLPIDKRKSFQKINLFVDKSRTMITRAKVVDKAGNTVDFNLKNINSNANIGDTTFVFDQKKYNKKIEVIE